MQVIYIRNETTPGVLVAVARMSRDRSLDESATTESLQVQLYIRFVCFSIRTIQQNNDREYESFEMGGSPASLRRF